jgi:ketosteroid isomerase-like protein
MQDVMISNLDHDGETRPFQAHGHAVVANAGALSVMRGVFEPGWRWSEDLAPLVGGSSCQVRHMGYVMSGSMRIRFDDGTEVELKAGDISDIPPGHDAWVTSEEPCTMIDVSPEATRYAVGRPTDIAAPDDTWMQHVRRGYAAFAAGDLDTLRTMFTVDVALHVPGSGPLAGTYKGPEAVLGYYAKLWELTGGTFRADLIDVHGDGHGHVTATHQTTAQRDGAKRVGRGSLLFTFVGDKVSDILELHGDLPGDDAFMA